MNSSQRIITGLVTTLLLAALAGVIWLTLRSQPGSVADLPTPAPATAIMSSTLTGGAPGTVTIDATATPALAGMLALEGLNFVFRPPLGYQMGVQRDHVTLEAPETGAAPLWLALANPVESGLPLADLLARLLPPAAALELSTLPATTVDGLAAERAGLVGFDEQDRPLAGAALRIDGNTAGDVVVVGFSSADRWAAEGSAVFQQLLDSLILGAGEPVAAAAVLTATTAAGQATAAGTPTTLATATRRAAVVATAAPTATRRPTVTATPAVTVTVNATATGNAAESGGLLPTPTPTAAPLALAAGDDDQWSLFSDGNQINEVVVAGTTVWAATDGGAVAWNRDSTAPVKFTVADGLGANRLSAVVDCPLPEMGIVFGSDRGLQIFAESGSWRTMTPANSELSFEDVSDLYCDVANEFLVVSYRSHGIDLFDAADNSWRHLDRNSGLAFNTADYVTVIGNQREIWVASAEGITVAAGQASRFFDAENTPLENTRLGGMLALDDGSIWIAGDGALYQTDGEEWTAFTAETVQGENFPFRQISALAAAGDGALWLGSVDGELCRFDPAAEACSEWHVGEEGMASGPISSIALGEAGELVFATHGGGFSRRTEDGWQLSRSNDEPLAGNQIRALGRNAENELWVATDAGLQRFSANSGSEGLITAAESGLPTDQIRALFPAPGGGLWAVGNGVIGVQGATLTPLTTEEGLAGETVYAVTVDSSGRTWFGTESGISVWNGASFFNITAEQGLPSADIRVLLAEGDAVWIGTAGGGLYRFEGGQLQLFNAGNVGLPSDNVTALALTGDGILLVGTDKGLVILADGAVTPVASLGSAKIASLVSDQTQNVVWAATGAGEIFRFAQDEWRLLPTTGRLPAAAISALLVDDDSLWIGGADGGLARYEP